MTVVTKIKMKTEMMMDIRDNVKDSWFDAGLIFVKIIHNERKNCGFFIILILLI